MIRLKLITMISDEYNVLGGAGCYETPDCTAVGHHCGNEGEHSLKIETVQSI